MSTSWDQYFTVTSMLLHSLFCIHNVHAIMSCMLRLIPRTHASCTMLGGIGMVKHVTLIRTRYSFFPLQESPPSPDNTTLCLCFWSRRKHQNLIGKAWSETIIAYREVVYWKVETEPSMSQGWRGPGYSKTRSLHTVVHSALLQYCHFSTQVVNT